MKMIRLPKNRALRISILIAAPFAIFLVAIFAYRAYVYRTSLAELNRIVAQLDADDPGWTWKAIQSRSKPVPPERDANRILHEIDERWPGNLIAYPPSMADGDYRRLDEPMPIPVAEWAGELLVTRAAILQLARDLADCPSSSGGHNRGLDLDLKRMQIFRETAQLLAWDIRVQSQLNRPEAAARSIRAMINLTRALSDDGLLIDHLVRMAVEFYCVNAVRDAGTLGQLSDLDLISLQVAFREESQLPQLARALRTERAWGFETMRKSARELNVKSVRDLIASRGLFKTGKPKVQEYQIYLIPYQYPLWEPHDQARYLQLATRAIEIANGDLIPMADRMKEIEDAEKARIERDGIRVETFFSDGLSGIFHSVAKSEIRRIAMLRTTFTAIAVERFRMANGRWPKGLDEIVPKYLERVPEDPYDGQPLRFRRLKNGIVVYSIGEDRIDDGGQVSPFDTPYFVYREPDEGEDEVWFEPYWEVQFEEHTNSDIGIRLYDPICRGKILPDPWDFLRTGGN